MAFLFKRHVIDEKLSPYNAVCRMKDEMPGQHVPGVSTWYNHIRAGDAGGVMLLLGCVTKRGRSKLMRPTP